LTVVAANDVDGIEMGVLSDGTAYMTGRAVARLCGTSISTILNQKDEWAAGKRTNKFARKLLAEGYTAAELCVPVKHKGSDALAYPETVVMAFLDYYAFEAPLPLPTAQSNFRLLAKAGLRTFVYAALGYDPTRAIPAAWRQFHDRLLLVSSPVGYFSIFTEASTFVLNAIRGGLPVDDRTIPDISIGMAWGKHWSEKQLDETCGQRIRYEHNYPDYFPQAASNPQHPWVYPVQAIGEFRIWLQREYVVHKFPKYLETKVAQGLLPPSAVQLLIDQATPVEPLLGE